MLRKTAALCSVAVLSLAGCQGGKLTAGDAATASAGSESPGQTAGAGIDAADLVWANDDILQSAKPGKDVMYLPTPPMVVEKMIEIADIRSTDLVYDLGTGDGRMAIAAAIKTGCRAIGFEIDAELVAMARENVRKAGLEHLVTIEEQDILDLDMSPADAILMYLTEDLNVAIIPQLAKMKPGARIVSHDWGMGGLLEPKEVIRNFRSKQPDFVNVHNIYMWETPLKHTPATGP